VKRRAALNTGSCPLGGHPDLRARETEGTAGCLPALIRFNENPIIACIGANYAKHALAKRADGAPDQ
jgi:hypothetical protein